MNRAAPTRSGEHTQAGGTEGALGVPARRSRRVSFRAGVGEAGDGAGCFRRVGDRGAGGGAIPRTRIRRCGLRAESGTGKGGAPHLRN